MLTPRLSANIYAQGSKQGGLASACAGKKLARSSRHINEVIIMRLVPRTAALMAVAGTAALLLGACSSSSSGTGGSSGKPPASKVPQLTAASFNPSFSAMKELKILASHGKGNVAAILPDTVSSTRYTEFDAPYLKEACKDAWK